MTFQDGRGLLAAGDEDASVSGPQNYALFQRLDRKYRFEALVVNYPLPDPGTAASLAASNPDADWGADRRLWALVAFDDCGMLYLRRGGRYADLIERDEFRLVRPANSYLNVPRDQAGQYLGELRRSVAAAPGCVRCRQLLGATAISIGAWDEAWNTVKPLLGEPVVEQAGAMLVGAMAAEGLGRNDDAATIHRQLIRLGQEVPTSRRALARLAFRRNDVNGALALLAPALRDGVVDPADVTLAIELLRAANRLDEAAAWTGRQQQLQVQQAAVQYFEKGMAAANQGNLQVAITWYEAALGVHETAEVRANIGHAYLDLGRPADAEAQYRRAIAIAPAFGPGWYGLGEALDARGDGPAAATAYRRFMELEPSGYWAAKAKQAIDRLERR